MNKNFYENQVIQICSDYAGVAHIGQLRKDGRTPYITHPGRVASLTATFLKGHPKLYIYVSAAWLHDVMEDCSEIIDGEYSYQINNHLFGNIDISVFLQDHDIISPFDGKEILEIAELLTMSQDKSIPKRDRKKAYYEDIRAGDPAATVIKYCDRIDNLITASIFSQNGFKWYLRDTENMMDTLKHIKDLSRFTPFMLDAHRLSLNMLRSELEEVKKLYKEMYL